MFTTISVIFVSVTINCPDASACISVNRYDDFMSFIVNQKLHLLDVVFMSLFINMYVLLCTVSTDKKRKNKPINFKNIHFVLLLSSYVRQVHQSNGIIDSQKFDKTHETVTILSIGGTPSSSQVRKSIGNFPFCKIEYLLRTRPINLST